MTVALIIAYVFGGLVTLAIDVREVPDTFSGEPVEFIIAFMLMYLLTWPLMLLARWRLAQRRRKP